jgi:hypothetical protein
MRGCLHGAHVQHHDIGRFDSACLFQPEPAHSRVGPTFHAGFGNFGDCGQPRALRPSALCSSPIDHSPPILAMSLKNSGPVKAFRFPDLFM